METKRDDGRMSRRIFVVTGAAAVAGVALRLRHRPMMVEAAGTALSPTVKIMQFSDDGKRLGETELPRVVKTEAEWKKILAPGSFEILRHADTEYPFHNAYWDLHDAGMFRCAGCNTALFSSATKYDSHTGWPSFWQPLAAENVRNKTDASLGEVRTEVRCSLCDGHLGHVFPDGPDPTGLRYCMNSGAMKFVKKA